MSKTQQLIYGDGFSLLLIHGLLPWRGATGKLSPDLAL